MALALLICETCARVKLIRTSIVFVASAAYVSYVFRLLHGTFWTSGLGDWMDPYFINYLLEHWYHAVRTLADPSSPPMYYPARQTLGYSHGLVLFAPFYVILRLLLHPFQAYNLTLVAVIETGILCLYLFLRMAFRLSFVESLSWSAFFFTSANVINGAASVWSQRVSVFLIPTILLILTASIRIADGPARPLLAGIAGLLAALLYTQDFYTGHFALFFAVILLAVWTLHERRHQMAGKIVQFWKGESPAARAALAAAGLVAVWVCALLILGGGSIRVLGVRVASHDWRRPALLMLGALSVFVWLRGWAQSAASIKRVSPWLIALAIGGAIGGGVFLWIYLGAYGEHPNFPETHLLSALSARDLSGWHDPLRLVREVGAYDSMRTFALVVAVATLTWLPWFRIDRTTRLYWVWVVLVSLVVLLVPLTFNGFSIWRTVFEPLPGFGVIRDPKRIIYLYELAVVIAIGYLLARLPPGSGVRIATTGLALVLLVTYPNREIFVFSRPIDVYDRSVGAPIDIDGSCQSFFISRASASYEARSPDPWTLYSIDAMFVSLNHSIPTLNGYSAWFPSGWDLFPQEPDYAARVNRWIERNRLPGVCALDIEARTMTPVFVR